MWAFMPRSRWRSSGWSGSVRAYASATPHGPAGLHLLGDREGAAPVGGGERSPRVADLEPVQDAVEVGEHVPDVPRHAHSLPAGGRRRKARLRKDGAVATLVRP